MTAEPDPAAGFFAGHREGQLVAAAVTEAIDHLGAHTVRVGRSQVGFARRRGFAYLWRPGRYIRSDVPAVLSVVLPRRVEHSRWKEVVHPSTRVWMHHLELWSPAEVDEEVRGWLSEAYDAAG